MKAAGEARTAASSPDIFSQTEDDVTQWKSVASAPPGDVMTDDDDDDTQPYQINRCEKFIRLNEDGNEKKCFDNSYIGCIFKDL